MSKLSTNTRINKSLHKKTSTSYTQTAHHLQSHHHPIQLLVAYHNMTKVITRLLQFT